PRPDQLDQRIGRGHRPGNENALIPGFVLGNYVYAKEGNTRRFEILQNKYIPVKQALSNPDKGPRRIEEEVEVTLEDIQA
ncbi:hypothetical protein, partial [Faecalibacillus intestinalis]|uniref:hypothetical protein n=1 Tax=Faecalibacillus intestinalis TaxID=1982626 RepID=UPI001EE077F2